jgi:hypothetical protein
VTARPVLTVAGPDEYPASRGPSWWRFRLREAAENARWHLAAAIMATVATTAVRHRAAAAGFGMALGDPAPHYWLSHLGEHADGWQAADDLRYDRGDKSHGPARPFLLPDFPADRPEGNRPAPAWPPLVAPRPAVVSMGEHAAPESGRRVRNPDRSGTVPRHRRPSPVTLAARWLRDTWPWQRKGGTRQRGRDALRAAA